VTLVDQLYQQHIDSLSPKEKMAISMSMLAWMREQLARQITKEKGPLSAERLKWEVARRLYIGDPKAVAFIDQILANVSD